MSINNKRLTIGIPGRYNICMTAKGLVTNYGEGGYKTGGVCVKFYPYEKGGGGKKF